MKGFLKTLIWFVACMQVLLILFIVFSKVIDRGDTMITLDKNDNYENIFMPKFEKSEITEEIKERIFNNSFVPNDNIKLEDLSYLTIAHYTFDGEKKNGEMIVNKEVADEVLQIFRTLYENRYAIERMELIDNYGADDYASIEANNTSGFCYRNVEKTNTLSNHAYGLAIDINPLQNPYVVKGTTSHSKSTTYIDRDNDRQGMIQPNDLCVKTFKEHGWTWGGDWEEPIDYQHFEKTLNK